MSVKTLKSVPVPAEFIKALGSEVAARQEMTRLAVVELVRKHVVPAGRGAKLLGLDRTDFEDVLADHEVPTFELLPGETMADHLRDGQEVMKQLRTR